MIAALYVEKGGCYYGLPNVEDDLIAELKLAVHGPGETQDAK